MYKELNSHDYFEILEEKSNQSDEFSKKVLSIYYLDLFLDLLKGYQVEKPLMMKRHDFLTQMSNRSTNNKEWEVRRLNTLSEDDVSDYNLFACIRLGKESLRSHVLEVILRTDQTPLIFYRKSGMVELDELIEDKLLKNHPDSLERNVNHDCTIYNPISFKSSKPEEIKLKDVLLVDVYGKINEEIKDAVEYSFLTEEDMSSRKNQKQALKNLRADSLLQMKVMSKVKSEYNRIIKEVGNEEIHSFILRSTKKD